MRRRISLAVAGAVTVAGAAAFVAAPAASARPCPDGTRFETRYVAGVPVSTCWPYFQPCDPGPCDPPPTELRD